MKLLLFILLSVLANTVAYFMLQLIFAVIDKFTDKWLYNKGRCRDCGGDYKYYIRNDNYELYECAKCGQMICIKKSNTTQ